MNKTPIINATKDRILLEFQRSSVSVIPICNPAPQRIPRTRDKLIKLFHEVCTITVRGGCNLAVPRTRDNVITLNHNDTAITVRGESDSYIRFHS